MYAQYVCMHNIKSPNINEKQGNKRNNLISNINPCRKTTLLWPDNKYSTKILCCASLKY